MRPPASRAPDSAARRRQDPVRLPRDRRARQRRRAGAARSRAWRRSGWSCRSTRPRSCPTTSASGWTSRACGCMGVHVALDGFGGGSSALAHLTRLPIDILKLDRSLISRIDRDPQSRALCESIIGIGRALGLDVVRRRRRDAGAAGRAVRLRLRLRPGLPDLPSADARRLRGTARRGRRACSGRAWSGPARADAAGAADAPGGGNGHACPYSGTGRLTSPAGEAHSVQVPRARLLVTGCTRSLVVA